MLVFGRFSPVFARFWMFLRGKSYHFILILSLLACTDKKQIVDFGHSYIDGAVKFRYTGNVRIVLQRSYKE